MVHFLEVGELVADNVIEGCRGLQDQPPVERDAAAMVAAAPAGARRGKAQGRGRHAELGGVMCQALGKNRPGMGAQSGFQRRSVACLGGDMQMQASIGDLPAETRRRADFYGQRLAKHKNAAAVFNGQAGRCRAFAAGREFFEYPVRVFAQKLLDFAERGAQGGCHAQTVMVDGQADAAAGGAA